MDSKDRDSYSPLMCAVWKGRTEVVQVGNLLYWYMCVCVCVCVLLLVISGRTINYFFPFSQYLLENGSRMHLTDSSGKTVLHIAVEENHEETLELLLSKPEANDLIDAVDKENKTALHYAAMGGNRKVVNKSEDSSFSSVFIAQLIRGPGSTFAFSTHFIPVSDFCLFCLFA